MFFFFAAKMHSVDPTGKKNGRGAYLTLDKECILAAKKKNTLQNQFQSQIDDQIFDELLESVSRTSFARAFLISFITKSSPDTTLRARLARPSKGNHSIPDILFFQVK